MACHPCQGHCHLTWLSTITLFCLLSIQTHTLRLQYLHAVIGRHFELHHFIIHCCPPALHVLLSSPISSTKKMGTHFHEILQLFVSILPNFFVFYSDEAHCSSYSLWRLIWSFKPSVLISHDFDLAFSHWIHSKLSVKSIQNLPIKTIRIFPSNPFESANRIQTY